MTESQPGVQPGAQPGAAPGADELIDPRALLAATTTEELAARADELVRHMEDPSALLAKPVSSLREAPDLLACFGMLLGGLAPLPEMTVLDFGAGSCWTSHFLAQLGCEVIAMDISAAMLELGARRFAEHPLFGDRPAPRFSVFDGTRMDLPDASVDRVLCFDALHHVANMPDVIAEMGRVLRPGGVAGFSEPGPHHSRDPQSQHEMRRYGVPECDVVLAEVWAAARGAGFADLRVAVFSPSPQWVGMGELDAFLTERPADAVDHALRPRGRAAVDRALRGVRQARRAASELRRLDGARVGLRHLSFVRGGLQNRRMFLLRQAGEELVDSREASGLACELAVSGVEVFRLPAGSTVSGLCRVRNTGRNRWLPSSADLGAVRLGLRVRRGPHPAADHGRVALPGDRAIEPGGAVEIPFETEVQTPADGERPVVLELDLVAEGITWFASVRGRPFEIDLTPPSPDSP